MFHCGGVHKYNSNNYWILKASAEEKNWARWWRVDHYNTLAIIANGVSNIVGCFKICNFLYLNLDSSGIATVGQPNNNDSTSNFLADEIAYLLFDQPRTNASIPVWKNVNIN